MTAEQAPNNGLPDRNLFKCPIAATGVTGLALHTLMQGTATTARYTKRYVQVD